MFREWYEKRIENSNSKEELDQLLRSWLKTLSRSLQKLGETATRAAFEVDNINIRIMEMYDTDEECAMSLNQEFKIKSCQDAALSVEQSLAMVQLVHDKRQKVLDKEYERIVNLIREQENENENAAK